MNTTSYYTQAENTVRGISAELEELKLQAGLLKLEAKDEYDQKMKILSARTEEARTRVMKLKDCSEDTLQRMKDELEQTFRFVKGEIKDLKNRCFESKD